MGAWFDRGIQKLDEFPQVAEVIERSGDKKLTPISKLIQMKHMILADLQSFVNLFLVFFFDSVLKFGIKYRSSCTTEYHESWMTLRQIWCLEAYFKILQLRKCLPSPSHVFSVSMTDCHNISIEDCMNISRMNHNFSATILSDTSPTPPLTNFEFNTNAAVTHVSSET